MVPDPRIASASQFSAYLLGNLSVQQKLGSASRLEASICRNLVS